MTIAVTRQVYLAGEHRLPGRSYDVSDADARMALLLGVATIAPPAPAIEQREPVIEHRDPLPAMPTMPPPRKK